MLTGGADRDGSSQWDRCAAATPGIDRWCSRTPWMLAVHAAFDDEPARHLGAPVVGAAEHGCVGFVPRLLEDGTPALLPFDAVWAFASAVVTDAPDASCLAAFVADAVSWIVADERWRLSAWPGLISGSELDSYVIAALAMFGRVHAGPTTDRCVASLDGGLDGWLSRRSRTFRRNLRQADRRGEEVGVRFETLDDQTPDTILRRLHTIERQSWKGRIGSGIETDDMAVLYATLVHRLSRQHDVRCTIATLEGRDVGFVLGGVLGDTYRGLQLSYVDDVGALSIGRLLQWHELQRLSDAGVSAYDLGMDMLYKRAWAEQIVSTRTLLCIR